MGVENYHIEGSTPKEKIKAGDTVMVKTNSVILTPKAEVISVPQSPGEPYVFKVHKTDFEGNPSGYDIMEITEGITLIKQVKK